jgi:hypothetical protein
MGTSAYSTANAEDDAPVNTPMYPERFDFSE